MVVLLVVATAGFALVGATFMTHAPALALALLSVGSAWHGSESRNADWPLRRPWSEEARPWPFERPIGGSGSFEGLGVS